METETRIQQALRDLEARATTFIIAHRISSVLHADQILVMDHGEIVERGRHAELVRQGGLYAEYFRVQYGGRGGNGNGRGNGNGSDGEHPTQRSAAGAS
jgi:ABC-type multidrug transport system fused ATPase/permease subunit